MWYRLKNKPSVEYSTDFEFFKQNQISVVKSGRNYSFQSRLESKRFHHTSAVLRENYSFGDLEIERITKQIHEDILSGKHGEGSLVN